MRVTLIVLGLVAATTAQFQFQFDDMFGGQGGDGGGQQFGNGGPHEPAPPEPIEKGYLCKDTKEVVDHPRQCPCPGFKMVKCKLDDWYVCYPTGYKCPEGKFSKLDEPVADEFADDYDEE
eukprot:m.47285 g.47285  ORF g.47285 m.47285 type:complete len:120 (+) comp8841_c0_seq1:167-526(+)